MAARGGKWWLPRWAQAAITLGACIVAAGLTLWTCGAPGAAAPAPAPPPYATAAASGARGASLKDISNGAMAEGEVRLQASLPEDWRRRFESAFDREFGFHVSLQQVTSGGDALLGSEADFARLYAQGKLGSYAWESLFGVPSRAVLFGGGAIGFAQRTVQPLYNVQTVGTAAAPSGWDALLDPRWKGRIGVSDDAQPWVALSASWGDTKTVQFVQALAAQAPRHGSEAELERQLQSGSLDVLAAGERSSSAAVAAADVQPVVLLSEVAGPLKDAAHPNAALLFAGFLATEEGQQLWREYSGESSAYVDGTPAALLTQSKQYVLPDGDFLQKDFGPRLASYAKLLGYPG